MKTKIFQIILFLLVSKSLTLNGQTKVPKCEHDVYADRYNSDAKRNMTLDNACEEINKGHFTSAYNLLCTVAEMDSLATGEPDALVDQQRRKIKNYIDNNGDPSATETTASKTEQTDPKGKTEEGSADKDKKAAQSAKEEKAAQAESEKKAAQAAKLEKAALAESEKKAAQAAKDEKAAQAESEKKAAQAAKDDKAAQAENDKKASQATKEEKAAQAENDKKAEKAAKEEKSAQAENAKNAEKAAKAEKAAQAEIAKKAEKAAKEEKAAQAKSEKAGKGKKGKKSGEEVKAEPEKPADDSGTKTAEPVTNEPVANEPTPSEPEKTTTETNEVTEVKTIETPKTETESEIDPPIPPMDLKFSSEEVAQFQDKGLQKIKLLEGYIKQVASKTTSASLSLDATENAILLFDSEGRFVEVSNINSDAKARYKIRKYLERLRFLNFDDVDITWADFQYTSDFIKGPDGNYHGYIIFRQRFTATKDNQVVYEDVTTKKTEVILKFYSKAVGGVVTDNWDVLLGDISVEQTEKQ